MVVGWATGRKPLGMIRNPNEHAEGSSEMNNPHRLLLARGPFFLNAHLARWQRRCLAPSSSR